MRRENGGQTPFDTQTLNVADAEPTIDRLQSADRMLAPQKSKRRRHSASDTHSNCAAAGGDHLKGDPHLESVPSKKRGRKAVSRGQIAVDTQTQGASASSIGNDHSHSGTHSPFVIASAGHLSYAAHGGSAGAPHNRDQNKNDTHAGVVAVGDQIGPVGGDSHFLIAGLIAEIREQWRCRQNWHRAEKSLTLQIRGTCRRLVSTATTTKGEAGTLAEPLYQAILGKGEHPQAATALAATFPLLEARRLIEKQRKAVEKRLAEIAVNLPGADHFISTPRLGIGGFASIVGEAGDLSNYATVAKLWKRMGAAVMPDGQRQRKVAGAEAMDHGYSPSRYSVIWTLADSAIKGPGPYRDLYLARKVREQEKAVEEGLVVAPSAKIPAKRKDEFRSEGHIHNRCRRYVGKRILRDLWVAWRRDQSRYEPHAEVVPPTSLLEVATSAKAEAR